MPDTTAQLARTIPNTHRHPDTAVTLASSSEDLRFIRGYRKTYDYPGELIDARHSLLARSPTINGMLDVGVEGWLLIPDALKLYELAYFCGGDVLELGTFRGLSTAILASALDNVGSGEIVTVDLDPSATDKGRKNMWGRPGAERVHFFTLDAIKFVKDLGDANRRFEFAFIDHSHHYEHVLPTCQKLAGCMKPGAFILFHDYNDPRNFAADSPDYGVFQGVTEGLGDDFELWGVYGCTALYRYNGYASGEQALRQNSVS